MYDLYLTINFLDASYILVFFLPFIGRFNFSIHRFISRQIRIFLGITFLNSR